MRGVRTSERSLDKAGILIIRRELVSCKLIPAGSNVAEAGIAQGRSLENARWEMAEDRERIASDSVDSPVVVPGGGAQENAETDHNGSDHQSNKNSLRHDCQHASRKAKRKRCKFVAWKPLRCGKSEDFNQDQRQNHHGDDFWRSKS